ncbi:S8 family peptidase [Actinospica robiniae]|uniref:S8 family peptidase n=1 Tax=Actinospica robiniae TaxID=304901 RepID=UPI000409C610|nr:S8 family serine peptidase [Actinospica robiniae]
MAGSGNAIADKEWALVTLQATKIRSEFNAQGAGVVVAVLDTGVDPSQPDLQGSFVPGVNLIDSNSPTTDTRDDNYSESHGTSIATVIAGHGHTGSGGTTGVIGLAPQAKIMPIKVMPSSGEGGSEASLDAGIKYATDHGARVLNISNGSPGGCSELATDAIDYALSHNVVVVAATGNTALSGNQPGCPANVPGVLDVAALDQTSHMDKYSHYGSDVTLAAPGVSIEGGMIGGSYNENSGSSQASPMVAAEAALIISLHPTWTQGQVVAAIIDNTAQVVTKETKPGKRYDDHVGYGVIDPLAALGAAEPASTANPLGGPAVSASASPNATAPTGSGQQNPGTAGGTSSSSAGLIGGVVVAIVVIGGLVLFLAMRGSRRSRGPVGGGSDNGYYPPMPPGGQYAPPAQGNQQPIPHQPQYPQQGQYQPQYPQQGQYAPQYPQQGQYQPQYPQQGSQYQPQYPQQGQYQPQQPQNAYPQVPQQGAYPQQQPGDYAQRQPRPENPYQGQ